MGSSTNRHITSTLSSACQPQAQAHPHLFPCLVVVFLGWMEITGSARITATVFGSRRIMTGLLFSLMTQTLRPSSAAPRDLRLLERCSNCQTYNSCHAGAILEAYHARAHIKAYPARAYTSNSCHAGAILEAYHARAHLKAYPARAYTSHLTICDDRETSFQTRNGFDCATDTGRLDKNCNKDAKWTEKGYCRLSCYKAGNGYPGDVCCDEELQNRKNLRGR